MPIDLTKEHIREMLRRFIDAIETDQLRVDAIPPSTIMPLKNDDTWRIWRRDHVTLIGRLLATTDTITATTLDRIAYVAGREHPLHVGNALLELCAEIVSHSVDMRDFENAEQFFASVMNQFATQPRAHHQLYSATIGLERWIQLSDPLEISKDPEVGFVLTTH